MHNHLKQLVNTYKPVRTLEHEFCEHFGTKFTTPFSKVESDPDIPKGKECALEARKHFHAARTFCANYGPMKHPAYDHIVLENYLIAKIKELSNPVHNDIMKYIRILRHLRPNSPYAFTGCDDLAAVQSKLALLIQEPPKTVGKVEKTDMVVPFQDIDIHAPISIETIKALDDAQLNSLIDRKVMPKTLPNGKPDASAAISNTHLLSLAKLAREIGGMALLWMKSGFSIRQSIDFQNFASEQFNMKDQSNLAKAMSLVNLYHHFQSEYQRQCGFSDDADKHTLEHDLSSYLSEAFQHSNPTVRHKVLRFASVDSIDDVDDFVDFFAGLKDLPYVSSFFWGSRIQQNHRHSAIYRLILARLDERKVPKVVPGVDMKPPKNAKEWYNHIVGHLSYKIQPILEVAKKQDEILAARNDFLNRPKNEHFNEVFRVGSVLWSLKCVIKKEIQPYLISLGIPDIKAAWDNMESYKDSNSTFYNLLKKNQKALELSLHGLDSDYAVEDVKRAIRRREELRKLDILYRDISAIISHFAKDNAACVLESDGSITCQDKYVQSKLRELEQDIAWEGHDLFKQFLDEARQKKSIDEIQDLARTFLATKMDSCSNEQNKLDEMYGAALNSVFGFV